MSYRHVRYVHLADSPVRYTVADDSFEVIDFFGAPGYKFRIYDPDQQYRFAAWVTGPLSAIRSLKLDADIELNQ